MQPVLYASALCLLGSALTAVAAPARWTLDATLDAGAHRLLLRGCSADAQERILLRAGAHAAAHLLELERDGQAIAPDADGGVRLAGWQAGECYRAVIDLRSAAAADRFGLGGEAGKWWRLPPETWLWRPRSLDPASTIDFHLPAGWAVSAPWPRTADGSGRRTLGATPDDWPAQVAFGRFEERRLELPGGTLRVATLPLVDAGRRATIDRWFAATAPLLLAGDGRLPLADVQVLILPLPGVSEPVPWGQVSRGGAAGVLLVVGADAGFDRLQADWTAAHELAHLQHPFLGSSGRWLAEGLASYHQNVWRARLGLLTPEQAWRKLEAGFERGKASAAGVPLARLGRTRESTMRVYWSGAAYWLESDLALRAAGSSLDAVLAEFRRRHLPSARWWHPREFIAELDRQVPAGGLLARYNRYLADADFPDLRPALALLGRARVAHAPGDPQTPWSAAIMAPPALLCSSDGH